MTLAKSDKDLLYIINGLLGWDNISPGGLCKGETVASAATIRVTSGITLVTITGTTNITSIVATTEGHLVTLMFQGALTFTDGSNLKLAGNFVTTADDTITLVCNGTNWYECARSIN